MSMILCKGCRDVVDTDADPDGWVETKYGDEYYCQPCRDNQQVYRDKGDHMAALVEDRQ